MSLLRFGVRSMTVVASLMVVMSCASSEPQSDLDFEVDGSEIRLAISEEFARGAVEGLLGSSLECDGEIDDGLRELLTALERGGTRSHAARRDGETTLDARRRGGRHDHELRGSGPGKIQASMPWAVAECLLGRTTTVERAVSSTIKVKVINPDGRNFSFKVQ
jgi:hypothetical protein